MLTISPISPISLLGVGLSLDDFGTGYSSLSQLAHCPFDRLKIDRSFVRELPADDRPERIAASRSSRQALWMIQAISSLGGGLGMATVAEGVETEQQARQVLQAGVTDLQGYLIARPMPEAEVAAFITRMDAAACASQPDQPHQDPHHA